jgi:ABC-type branched-subunit amino acid transport system substrate-binding protein
MRAVPSIFQSRSLGSSRWKPLLTCSTSPPAPDDIGRLVKQMREAGLDQSIFGGDGYDTPLLLETAGAAAHDTYFTTHVFLDPSQSPTLVQRFIADYEPEYGVPRRPRSRRSPTIR